MIIGITGPAGAGKDLVAIYIADKLKIPHISGGDIIRDMLRGAGLEPTKTSVVNFGVYLRANYSVDAVAKRAVQKAGEHENFIYSGFRSIAEASVAKEKGVLLYIDASDEVRYGRIASRLREGDSTDIQVLRNNDQKERSSKLVEGENLEDIKAQADQIITNDGTLDELYSKVDDFCVKINLEH